MAQVAMSSSDAALAIRFRREIHASEWDKVPASGVSLDLPVWSRDWQTTRATENNGAKAATKKWRSQGGF